jgi:hypothetical protein
VLSSIDSGLDTFGKNVRIVVYFELNKFFGVSRENIVLKPEALAQTIEKIFGLGAKPVNRVILTKLEETTGIRGLSDHDLTTAIRTAYHSQLEKMY